MLDHVLCARAISCTNIEKKFVAGCGRFFEGTAEQMNQSLCVTLASLPKPTLVYCGLEMSLRFFHKILFSEPLRVVEKYPAGDGEDLKKKHMVCLNWLLSEKPLDLETELMPGFLDHLLLGTPASPLRKTLLESWLGEALRGGGIEDELLQPQFSIGLEGVYEDNLGKVEELVMSTLKNLAKMGFDSDAVEASMNTI